MKLLVLVSGLVAVFSWAEIVEQLYGQLSTLFDT